MKYRFLFLLFIASHIVSAQVPSVIEFGGMELKLTDAVRKKLQADIDMITRGQKAFQNKVDRADLYFPIIEKIFQEEGLPDDFKFLSLQESSLVSDAVSTSNAVGYWQFKKETAIEVGLRVDHVVDERINIVASSRGAAKYLKKNNSLYFDNWIYALLAYNLGAGGAKSKIKEKYIGAKKMVIDEDMHWYVIRFLAHKLAYENAVGKNLNPPMYLVAYKDCKNKSLKDISREMQIDMENLEMYNKWLLKGHVPDDKDYWVILPVNAEEKEKIAVKDDISVKPESREPQVKGSSKEEGYEVKIKIDRRGKKKEIQLTGTGDVALTITINGIRTIKAKEGDTPSKLAIQGGISTDDFLKYNDMKSFEQIKAGAYYYLQPKRNKGLVFFHTIQPGETLRDVSQKYGIRIESIRKKNRMGKNENPEPGRELWLRRKRPENIPVVIKKIESPVKEVTKETEIIKEEKALPEKVKPEVKPVQPELKPLPDSLAPEPGYHTVKQGETLYSISRLYAIPLDSLKLWNNLPDNSIGLGQKLIIGKNTEVPKNMDRAFIEHIVQPGETLYQISKKYGVSVENIQIWNNKADSRISLGERLLIKSSLNK